MRIRKENARKVDVKPLHVFCCSGFGSLVVGFLLWNDAFGLASHMKNSGSLMLAVFFLLAAFLGIFLTHIIIRVFPLKVACWFGAVGWICVLFFGYQQSQEIASMIH
jgi:hypothetical protein